jgi:hypothetical protein
MGYSAVLTFHYGFVLKMVNKSSLSNEFILKTIGVSSLGWIVEVIIMIIGSVYVYRSNYSDCFNKNISIGLWRLQIITVITAYILLPLTFMMILYINWKRMKANKLFI